VDNDAVKAPWGRTLLTTCQIKLRSTGTRAVPSPLNYGPQVNRLWGWRCSLGTIFRFNEDVKRLSEAILEQSIVAGVCVVPSDELAKYKADRGASFSDARSKLDRSLALLQGSGAAMIPGLYPYRELGRMDFTDTEDGKFSLIAPQFDPCARVPEGPRKAAFPWER